MKEGQTQEYSRRGKGCEEAGQGRQGGRVLGWISRNRALRQEGQCRGCLCGLQQNLGAVTPARRTCSAYPSHPALLPNRTSTCHLPGCVALRGSPCTSLRMRELGELPHPPCPSGHTAPPSTMAPTVQTSCLLVLLLPMERACPSVGLMDPGGLLQASSAGGRAPAWKRWATSWRLPACSEVACPLEVRALSEGSGPIFCPRRPGKRQRMGQNRNTEPSNTCKKTQTILIYPIICLSEVANDKFSRAGTWCPCSAGPKAGVCPPWGTAA